MHFSRRWVLLAQHHIGERIHRIHDTFYHSMRIEMTPRLTVPRSPARRSNFQLWPLLTLAGPVLAVATAGAQGDSTAITQNDPRIGLRAGYNNAAEVARNLELVGHATRPQNFGNPQNPGDFGFLNGDLAFRGNYAFQGGFNGFQIWDISNPKSPTLRMSLVCPGGQGDPSVYKNLLFISVEETRGRLDCGTQGVPDTVSAERVRGVRIFADSMGAIGGLWKGGAHGPGTQTTSDTNRCHDITVYTALGVAAGACSGNGILLDIRDPANPKRIAAVMDPNFAFWHSATFNNEGTKVLFTDEWGG